MKEIFFQTLSRKLKTFFLIALFTAVGQQTFAETVTQLFQGDDNVRLRHKGNSFDFLDKQGKVAAYLRTKSENQVNAEIKKTGIVLDTTESGTTTKRNLPLMFQVPERIISSESSGLKVRFTVTLSADREAEVMMMFMMQKQKKWTGTSKRTLIGKKSATLILETTIVPDTASVSPRIGFHTPAIYTIEKMSLDIFAEAQVSGTNQLPNGGAERGWLGTYGDPIKVQSDNEKVKFLGQWKTSDRVFELDDKEFHSGRKSFRITSKPDQANRFYVGPVKLVPGQPARITYWAKASKSVNIGMFLICNSGAAYGFPAKSQRVGREWKKISLLIPQWGKGGIGLDGNVNVHNEAYLCFSPQTDVTIWIDDISASVGSAELPFRQELFAVSGIMNKNNCNYLPGERIAAGVVVSNLSGKKAKYELSVRLLDYYGTIRWIKKAGSCEVPANSEKKINVPLTEKETLLGAQNLVVSVRNTESGTTLEHGFFFGRTRGEGTPVKRISMDLSTQSNSQLTLDMLKLIRAGTARIWASFRIGDTDNHSLEYTAKIHDGGIRTLLNAGPLGMKNATVQKAPSLTVSEYVKRITPYASKIDFLEFCNEPNIWRGRLKDDPNMAIMTEKLYAEYLKEIHSAFKNKFPNMKLAGPTVCTVDRGWIEQVLRAGGDKLLDLITFHPYCNTPEEYELAEKLSSMEQTVKAISGRKIPFAATESGKQYSAILNNNLIDEKARVCAAEDLRTMILACAGGAEFYTHFKLIPYGAQTSWNIVLGGTPANDYQPILHPAGYAFRGFADMVGDALFAGFCKIGSESRCVVFDNGSSRVAVLWKWKGASVKLNTKEFESKGKFFDIMGNPIRSGQVILDQSPIYYATSESLAELQKMCSRLEIPSNMPPLMLQERILSPNTFALDIKNCGNRTLSSELAVLIDGARIVRKQSAVPADGKVTEIFKTNKPITLKPQVVQADITSGGKQYPNTLALRAMTVPKAKKAVKIDGSLDDWNSVPKITLNASENAVRKKAELWSREDEKIKMDIQAQWTPEALYCAVTVHKPLFFTKTDIPTTLWDVDSVQFGFDPLKNAKLDKDYDDDDFEYTFALWKNQPTVLRHYASSSNYDSLPKKTGILDNNEVQLAIRFDGEKTVYEFALANRAVSPFLLKNGSCMRWNFLCNLNNGKGRMGWLELAPGLGTFPKRPAAFLDMVLIE